MFAISENCPNKETALGRNDREACTTSVNDKISRLREIISAIGTACDNLDKRCDPLAFAKAAPHLMCCNYKHCPIRNVSIKSDICPD
ncbi:hypothetical protein Ddc_19647 [Ditylenchus destructor]|nr:hypothetical protein Ddc_19647 [Ditylenchus destructor]